MNHTHPRKAQNMKKNCDCQPQESIPFLDTSIRIEEGQIVTDLYRKPTDRNQYLLTNSIHPPNCIKNIPYSLALRINRVCKNQKIEKLDLMN